MTPQVQQQQGPNGSGGSGGNQGDLPRLVLMDKGKELRVEVWRQEVASTTTVCSCSKSLVNTAPLLQVGSGARKAGAPCQICGAVIDHTPTSPKRLRRAVSGMFSRLKKVPDGQPVTDLEAATMMELSRTNAAKRDVANGKKGQQGGAAKTTKMYEALRGLEKTVGSTSSESSLVDSLSDSSDGEKRHTTAIVESAQRLRRAQKLLEAHNRKVQGVTTR